LPLLSFFQLVPGFVELDQVVIISMVLPKAIEAMKTLVNNIG
jgi:hypothetical protein